jgi:hypothetical protein
MHVKVPTALDQSGAQSVGSLGDLGVAGVGFGGQGGRGHEQHYPQKGDAKARLIKRFKQRWQFPMKAAEDSRTPRPHGRIGVRENAPASWSAAVLCRFISI